MGVIMTRELALVEISKPELVSKMHMRSLPYVPSCIALCAPLPPLPSPNVCWQYKHRFLPHLYRDIDFELNLISRIYLQMLTYCE